MTIQEYLEKYGDSYKTFLSGWDKGNNGIIVYEAGMLEFTKESAPCWGGPFPGGFALYQFSNYSDHVLGFKNSKYDGRYKTTERSEEFYKSNPNIIQEHATVSKPIRIWMLGNDDTSYSKFYTSIDEAREELELFKSNQPLDMEDVYSFKFVFTN